MRRSHVDLKERSNETQLGRTPIIEIEVVVELILCHPIANSKDLILELDFLNPISMKVTSILLFELWTEILCL